MSKQLISDYIMCISPVDKNPILYYSSYVAFCKSTDNKPATYEAFKTAITGEGYHFHSNKQDKIVWKWKEISNDGDGDETFADEFITTNDPCGKHDQTYYHEYDIACEDEGVTPLNISVFIYRVEVNGFARNKKNIWINTSMFKAITWLSNISDLWRKKSYYALYKKYRSENANQTETLLNMSRFEQVLAGMFAEKFIEDNDPTEKKDRCLYNRYYVESKKINLEPISLHEFNIYVREEHKVKHDESDDENESEDD